MIHSSFSTPPTHLIDWDAGWCCAEDLNFSWGKQFVIEFAEHFNPADCNVQALSCSMAVGIWHSAHMQQELLTGSAVAGGEKKVLTALRGSMPLLQH